MKSNEEKIKLELTVKELTILAYSIANASRSDINLGQVRDRRLRKLAREFAEERHKLWLKIISIVEKQHNKKSEV